MFEITVFKLHSDKFAKSQASSEQILLDHLKASADRNGFVAGFVSGEMSGEIYRDGREVAVWKIEEI